MSAVPHNVVAMKDLGKLQQQEAAVLAAADAAPELPSPAEIEAFARRVAAGHSKAMTDKQRIDYLRAGDTLTNAVAGSQAQVALDFDASQRAEQAREKVRPERQGRGVPAQIALARRGSHHRGQRWLHLAKRLQQMPDTFTAFREGRISELKASIISRITECLDPEVRAKVDLAIAGDPDWLESLSERHLEAEVSRLAYRFDPESFVKRSAQAVEDRRVTTRPAPDTMVRVDALLPVVQGVAVYAALLRDAKSIQAVGDRRSLGQLMADRLVELVTGQAEADQVPIAAEVTIADTTLIGMDDEPGAVAGYGPVPADVAKHLILTARLHGMATLRRLYTHPGTGRLIAMESRSREFPAGLAGLIARRDQGRCRNRWCGAAIRDIDHAHPKAEGGQTSFVNGQGTCEACNIAKEAPGWYVRPRPGPDGLHIIETTTPTGHVYTSVAPQVGIVRRPMAMELYVSEDSTLAS